jgi:uncharacterized protein
MKQSYVNPKAELKESPLAGKGLFAKELIKKGELVVDFSQGDGEYFSTADWDKIYSLDFDYGIQVDDDLFFSAKDPTQVEDADFINHSCDPTCGVKGKVQIVAMRDINPGEEISFDYAMSESSDYSMECKCGRPGCRKVITGNDWQIPELQEKYRGYFSDYLQKRIDKVRQSNAAS